MLRRYGASARSARARRTYDQMRRGEGRVLRPVNSASPPESR
jgi:hypothetical protein